MAGNLGDIVASLGIDRSRWAEDVNMVKRDTTAMTRLLANMGAQWNVSQANRAASDRMMGGMARSGESGLQSMFRRAREEAQALSGVVDKMFGRMGAFSRQQEGMLFGNKMASTQSSLAPTGLEGTLIRARKEAQALNGEVSELMSRLATASHRSMNMGLLSSTGLSIPDRERAQGRLMSIAAIERQHAARRLEAERALHRQDIYRIDSAEELLRLQNRQTMQLMRQRDLMDLTHLGGRGGSSRGGPSRSSSRNTMMILELGRGIEDAAIGFQMQGLSGAFRGAANNAGVLLSQLGRFGPYLMLASSLGIAWWGVSQAFGGVADKAKEAADRTRDLVEAMRRQFDEQVRLDQHRQSIRNQPDLETANQTLRDIRGQATPVGRELTRLQALQAEWEAWERTVHAQQFRGEITDAQEEEAIAAHAATRLAIAERIAELQKQGLNLVFDSLEVQAQINGKLEEEARIQRELNQYFRERELIANRQSAQHDILSVLNPAEARRRDARREGAERMQSIMGDLSLPQAEMRRLMDLNRRAVDRQLAGIDLAAFREQNGNLLGSRFGDAGFATTLESGSQEAFRAVAQHRQRDPQDEVLGVSRDQLKALHRIERQLEYRAEAEIDVGELDL